MIVAGFGCRKGTSCDELLVVLDAACKAAGVSRESLGALATGEIKRHEPGMMALAEVLGLTLHVVSDDELTAAGPRTKTMSRHSLAVTGTPSLSEAAALAVAGEGSELIVSRLISQGATCALAEMKENR